MTKLKLNNEEKTALKKIIKETFSKKIFKESSPKQVFENIFKECEANGYFTLKNKKVLEKESIEIMVMRFIINSEF